MNNSIPVSALLRTKPAVVWSISPAATVFEAIGLMADKNIGALPVLANGRVAGIFTERDYTRKIALQGKSSKNTQVWEVVDGLVDTVTPDSSIEDCMRLMTERRVRHLPVVQHGELLGMVSMGDLVNWTIRAQAATIAQMEQYVSGSYAEA
jgi:CBS domain-containing protein